MKERDKRSGKHLSKRYGRDLHLWADARRRTWGIDRSWTVEHLVVRLNEHQTTRPWERIETASEDLQLIDRMLCAGAGCGYGDGPPRYVDRYTTRTIDELQSELQTAFPHFTREQLRSLLFRLSREGVIRRVGRGVYSELPWPPWAWDPDEADSLNAVDNEETQWMAYYERMRQVRYTVFFAHYLLAHLQAYRKARALGISERTYYYWIGEVLEEVEWSIGAYKQGRHDALSHQGAVVSY